MKSKQIVSSSAAFFETLKKQYIRYPISNGIAGKSSVKYACPGEEWRANEKRGNIIHSKRIVLGFLSVLFLVLTKSSTIPVTNSPILIGPTFGIIAAAIS